MKISLLIILNLFISCVNEYEPEDNNESSINVSSSSFGTNSSIGFSSDTKTKTPLVYPTKSFLEVETQNNFIYTSNNSIFFPGFVKLKGTEKEQEIFCYKEKPVNPSQSVFCLGSRCFPPILDSASMDLKPLHEIDSQNFSEGELEKGYYWGYDLFPQGTESVLEVHTLVCQGRSGYKQPTSVGINYFGKLREANDIDVLIDRLFVDLEENQEVHLQVEGDSNEYRLQASWVLKNETSQKWKLNGLPTVITPKDYGKIININIEPNATGRNVLLIEAFDESNKGKGILIDFVKGEW